jgi:uncharacterized phage-associated protein
VSYSAHDVAAELRRRLPGLGTKKLHKLLYYCQGHHLAAVGEPLFGESLVAWDMGPVVDALWAAEKRGFTAAAPATLDEAALNTVGYVLSRHGALTGDDLEAKTHAEPPWRLADAVRRPGESAPIHPQWMHDYFAGDIADVAPPVGAAVGPDTEDTDDDLRAWAARGV